jgi:DNA excision repair protein ERCC-4
MHDNKPILVVDTREAKGRGWEQHLTTPFKRGTIKTGDLSIAGLESQVAIERKTLNDLVTCLSHQRARFEENLRRSTGMDYYAVVIEADLSDVAEGRFHSAMSSSSAWESIAALATRYKVPFIFAGNAETAARLAQSLLLKRYRHHTLIIEQVTKAAQQAAERN